MTKKITIIPSIPVESNNKATTNRFKRKVAAYARVSTDFDEQKTSFDAQLHHYENQIKNRSDWEFAGVYTDEGITGTNTTHREGFNKMIEDAVEGKIDLIITKSVSRFARNTVDSLSTIRLLKEHNVEVFFEKENIWTFDGKGEVLLTIMSSLAQEEARSTSENCKWGIRKRYAQGKFSLPYSRFLGYDKGPDGNPVINEEQAELVRRIFNMFLEGFSLGRIARDLTKENVPTPTGKRTWWVGTVRGILSNEKYKGDVLLQKSYVRDFLTKKQVPNDGTVQQYYIQGNHEPIIPEEIFNTVQGMLLYRDTHEMKYNTKHPFSGLLFCSQCGRLYGPRVWHSNDRFRKVVWSCNGRYGKEQCRCKSIDENALELLFLTASKEAFKTREKTIQEITKKLQRNFGIDTLEKELESLEFERNRIVSNINEMLGRKLSAVTNQKEYEMNYSSLEEEYRNTISEIDKLKIRKSEAIVEKQQQKSYMEYLSNTEELTEFSESDLRAMILKVLTDGETVTFVFKDGIKASLGKDEIKQQPLVPYFHVQEMIS